MTFQGTTQRQDIRLAAAAGSAAVTATAATTATTTPGTAASTTSRYWLGVVSRSHVQRGTGLGIAQLNHGKRSGLDRLSPGDWLVYYSPRTSYPDGEPLQAFTAIGEIADEEVWQADEGSFKPWRRRVRYAADPAEPNVRDLDGELDLTADPKWGHQLRRGLIELTAKDFAAIRSAMIGA